MRRGGRRRGSRTIAVQKRLHTAQPSLRRQLRDLEIEVGTQPFLRRARGIELTSAGRAFLDYRKRARDPAAVATEAAQQAGRPPAQSLGLGFLRGQELT